MIDHNNLTITKHCLDRFISRGRWLLYPEEIRSPTSAVKSMLKCGYLNQRLRSVPFYRNKLGCDVIVNGRFKFYIRDNTVVTCIVAPKGCENWRK